MDFFSIRGVESPIISHPDVEFLLWTRENPTVAEKLQVGNVTSVTVSHFSSDLPTKILIHGFGDTGTTGWVRNVRDSYLSKGKINLNASSVNFANLVIAESCNVISVDWRKLANTYPFYNIAAANTKPVGYLTADLIKFLVMRAGAEITLFHPIGFSLGAQVAGHTGHKLLGQLSRITGLDPAGLMFHNKPPTERLDPSDADFVDVIHSAGLWIGMDEPVSYRFSKKKSKKSDIFYGGGTCRLLSQPGSTSSTGL